MDKDSQVKRICAEAYLSHVRSLALRVQLLQEQIDRKRSMLEPCAIRYREASAPGTVGDAMEAGVIELHGLIRDYCTELVGYVEEQREAHHALMMLPRPEYAAALAGYYVHGKSWEQVCVDMGYSYDGIMSLRRRAVPLVYDVMPESWRRDAIPNAAPI